MTRSGFDAAYTASVLGYWIARSFYGMQFGDREIRQEIISQHSLPVIGELCPRLKLIPLGDSFHSMRNKS